MSLSFAILFAACGDDSGNTAKDEESSAPTEDFAGEQEYFVKYVDIRGSAKTGFVAFQGNTPVNIHELKSDLTPSGRIHYTTTSFDEGDFDFYDINLVYPYAKLEARGLYWNEVKGEWSKDSLTLRNWTSFGGNPRTDDNYRYDYYRKEIYLFDHLMYDRFIYLVQEKGFGFNDAWWQAAQEIMSAFGFLDESSMDYIDEIKRMDIDTGMVEDKGRLVEIHDPDFHRSMLLSDAIFRGEDGLYTQAIWTLFLCGHSDSEIPKAIDKFIADIRTDGVWDDPQTKADMADCAYELDYSKIQKNLEKRNGATGDSWIEIMVNFWENVSGLGVCGLGDNGQVRQNTNKFSKYYKKYFVCQEVDFKADWVESEREKVIGSCEEGNALEVKVYEGTYFTCKDNYWIYSTDLEKDTYQWTAGSEGEVRKGSVDSTHYYVYRNGEWQWDVSWIEAVFGGCTWDREGVVVKADSSFYTEYNNNGKLEERWEYYFSICKSRNWVEATEVEYDTYGWGAGKDGEVRAGSVNTDKYYVFENGAWRVSNGGLENSLGACVASREGEVAKHIISGSYLESGVDRIEYYICKSKKWKTSTRLQYDTQGWSAGTAGEMRTAIDDTSHHYIYRNNEWQYAEGSDLKFGACVAERLGEMVNWATHYYICTPSNYWHEATPLEYDTYGWDAGNDGEVRTGSVNTNKYYVYENGAWRASANEVEDDLGACVPSREGEVGYCHSGRFCGEEDNFCVDGTIIGGNYVCREGTWTKVELDTLGLTCLKDGSIVNGMQSAYNKYVCDANGFREANALERSLNKGCVIYNEGDLIRKPLAATHDSVYLCNNGIWNGSIDFFGETGIFTDSRDGLIYKTVTIGTQTWMAENLNYSDTGMRGRSWCYDNEIDNCTKYGRLYTWAAAMDSSGNWSNNGKGCGYEVACTPSYPVRGICPEGWHLPDTTEWNTLIDAVGGKTNAWKILRSENGWDDPYGEGQNKGSDAVSFTALSAGYRTSDGAFYGEGDVTHLWSSVKQPYSSGYAYYKTLKNRNNNPVALGQSPANYGFSVRCIKNQ